MMTTSTLASRRIFRPEFVLPSKAFSALPKKGMSLVDLQELGIIPGVGGGARGYHAAGDIITQTADGVDINQLWRDYQDMLAAFNSKRDTVLNFLTWRTTKAKEDMFASGTLADFEEATEYGEPVGVRPDRTSTSLGYMFKWYDLAARFTWMFLADADAQQVDAVANMAAEADNRLVFTQVMKTIFNNTRRTNKEGTTVYPFYSGVAGDLPPVYGTTTFADSHNHFVTNNNATLTAVHLDSLQTLLTEHGYNTTNGYTLILMINEAQEGTIRQFKSVANGGVGTFDFIPAQGTPQQLLPTTLNPDSVTRPASRIRGMEVVGSYGQMTVVKSTYIPAGYMFLFATGGEENVSNPVAIREHPQQSLRGLRLVKGKTPDYPLIDSFYNRGFGTGVRARGAGAVMQIVASATYTVPTQYVW
jgi:hypothetical protein